MFGLVVIKGMTPSGHLSNINEMRYPLGPTYLSPNFFTSYYAGGSYFRSDWTNSTKS